MDQSFNVLNLRNFTEVTLFRKQDLKIEEKKLFERNEIWKQAPLPSKRERYIILNPY